MVIPDLIKNAINRNVFLCLLFVKHGGICLEFLCKSSKQLYKIAPLKYITCYV